LLFFLQKKMVTLHCATIQDYRDDNRKTGIGRDRPKDVHLEIDGLYTGIMIIFFIHTNFLLLKEVSKKSAARQRDINWQIFRTRQKIYSTRSR